MAIAPSPVRRYVVPELGDDWSSLAARVLPGQADGASALQSWNLHIVYRPPQNLLLPSDVVFIEAPTGG